MPIHDPAYTAATPSEQNPFVNTLQELPSLIVALKPLIVPIFENLLDSLEQSGQLPQVILTTISRLSQSYFSKPIAWILKFVTTKRLRSVLRNFDSIVREESVKSVLADLQKEFNLQGGVIDLNQLLIKLFRAQIQWLTSDKKHNNRTMKNLLEDFVRTNPELKLALSALSKALLITLKNYKNNHLAQILLKLFPEDKLAQVSIKFFLDHMVNEENLALFYGEFAEKIYAAFMNLLQTRFTETRSPSTFLLKQQLASGNNFDAIRASLAKIILTLVHPLKATLKTAITKENFPQLMVYIIAMHNKHPQLEKMMTWLIRHIASLDRAHASIDKTASLLTEENVSNLLKKIPDAQLENLLCLLEQFVGNAIADSANLSYNSDISHMIRAKKIVHDIFSLMSHITKKDLVDIAGILIPGQWDHLGVKFYLHLFTDDRILKKWLRTFLRDVTDTLDPLEVRFHQSLTAFETLLLITANKPEATLEGRKKLIARFDQLLHHANTTSAAIALRVGNLRERIADEEKTGRVTEVMEKEICNLEKTNKFIRRISGNETAIKKMLLDGSQSDHKKLLSTMNKIRYKLHSLLQDRQKYVKGNNSFLENIMSFFYSDPEGYLRRIRNKKIIENTAATQLYTQVRDATQIADKLSALNKAAPMLNNMTTEIELKKQLKSAVLQLNVNLKNSIQLTFFKEKTLVKITKEFSSLTKRP